jgi:hypothetical protein
LKVRFLVYWLKKGTYYYILVWKNKTNEGNTTTIRITLNVGLFFMVTKFSRYVYHLQNDYKHNTSEKWEQCEVVSGITIIGGLQFQKLYDIVVLSSTNSHKQLLSHVSYVLLTLINHQTLYIINKPNTCLNQQQA